MGTEKPEQLRPLGRSYLSQVALRSIVSVADVNVLVCRVVSNCIVVTFAAVGVALGWLNNRRCISGNGNGHIVNIRRNGSWLGIWSRSREGEAGSQGREAEKSGHVHDVRVMLLKLVKYGVIVCSIPRSCGLELSQRGPRYLYRRPGPLPDLSRRLRRPAWRACLFALIVSPHATQDTCRGTTELTLGATRVST